MGFIGEQFTSPNEVTGLVLNVMHNNDRISVWMRHGTNHMRVKEVKKDLIRIMSLPHDVKLDFRLFFPDTEQKASAPAQKEPAANKGSRDLKPYRVVAAKSKNHHNNLAPPQSRDRGNTSNSGLSSDN